MHSIAINNEVAEKRNRIHPSPLIKRPNLSIDTDTKTTALKKNAFQQFFSPKDKSVTDIKSSSSPKRPLENIRKYKSLPALPVHGKNSQHHHSSSINLNSILPKLTGSPLSSISSHDSSTEKLSEKSDSERPKIHSSNNTGSQVFKKFHMPHFSKRTNTASFIQDTLSQYQPIIPEPIMPTLVNWSPEVPISLPPWELDDNSKRHSIAFQQTSAFVEEPSVLEDHESFSTIGSHSDSEIFDHNNRTSPSTTESSDVTSLSTQSSHDINDTFSLPVIRRRSSCPIFDRSSSSFSSSSSKTLVENDIIAITEFHTRNMSILRRYRHPVEKKSAFKPCQRAKARAAEAASNGELMTHTNSFFDSLCEDTLKYLYIPNVFDPVTREPIVEFALIKPRKYQLYRKTNWKREAKAIMTWHHVLEERLRNLLPFLTAPVDMPMDKAERSLLTRKFILREFFLTEVNFWNQLYYTKIVFYDFLIFAFENGSPFTKPSHADIFANLFDLMQFSAKLINRIRHLQIRNVQEFDPRTITEDDIQNNTKGIECNASRLGRTLVEMSEDLVVFLRCAIDYRGNRKLLDSIEGNNKAYSKFRQKLSSRKETSQFTLKDYLIIPIQRVARYGLLLADLLKHTTPTHPDYLDLIKAYHIVTSLASAMDLAQKKKKEY